MTNPYDQGYVQALAEIGDTFATLADQAQAEINQAIHACQAARSTNDQDGEDAASRELVDAMRRKVGFMSALQITMNAEARHRIQTTAA